LHSPAAAVGAGRLLMGGWAVGNAKYAGKPLGTGRVYKVVGDTTEAHIAPA